MPTHLPAAPGSLFAGHDGLPVCGVHSHDHRLCAGGAGEAGAEVPRGAQDCQGGWVGGGRACCGRVVARLGAGGGWVVAWACCDPVVATVPGGGAREAAAEVPSKCVCTGNSLPRLNSCRPGQPSPQYSLPQPMRSFSSCPGQSACSLQDPRIERLPCTHKGTYADDCICERVKQHRCYIVATCDRDLRRWAAQRSIAQRSAAQRGWSCSGTGQCSKQGLMAV